MLLEDPDPEGSPYRTQDPKSEYTYYLNVCGKISEGGCAGDTVSACQQKMSSTLSKSAGSYQNQTLRLVLSDISCKLVVNQTPLPHIHGHQVCTRVRYRSSDDGRFAANLGYSDGDITLTYPGGEICSSGFQRMTVINFICNETAGDRHRWSLESCLCDSSPATKQRRCSDRDRCLDCCSVAKCDVNAGKGVPEFESEADCTYFFSWQTKYACLKKKEDMCYVESKKKQYNLFNLIRTSESSNPQNWEAVNLNPSDKSCFYINVCHDVLQTGDASVCEDDAAVCAVGPDSKKNLGKFLTPPKFVNEHIVLEYTDGSTCAGKSHIRTSITLICSPGNHESPPILKSFEDCYYAFEWNTAAACVVSRTEGDDCTVADPQAGFYFDLSPLTNKTGTYKIVTDMYSFYINVCGNVTQQLCEPNSGACQVDKASNDHWNLGVSNSKLSYYDGMIQLHYTNGTAYNDEKKTPRSSLITFLCDRSVDIGQPEYQLHVSCRGCVTVTTYCTWRALSVVTVTQPRHMQLWCRTADYRECSRYPGTCCSCSKEDNNTYNFKWYTKYACPALPVACIVVDKENDEQYDLSSLSKVQGELSSNWFAMDQTQETHKKYYINVCRSLVPLKGCDPFAAVCQMGYEKVSGKLHETVAISNLGVASKEPVIEDSGKILIEYTNGSKCIDEENKEVFYSSQLHLTCEKGAVFTSPRFISNNNCVATFLWNTEAACPVIKNIHGKEDCLIENPNTGFTYNFESLKNESGYMAQGNGKKYKLNICGPVSGCGQIGDSPAAGCEIDNQLVSRPVKLSQSLDLASEGTITLTYSGTKDEQTGAGDSFTINFVCNDDLYPGRLLFNREEINSETHLYHTFFDFETAMACSPAPVDCQVTG
ncbi:unnamed protein product [Ranitomeya imitator]|uniref:MRH domain-containing protein n=1 Tax=Ranitomeya imitator TaxID=111125 RepID=A0ABN9LXT6_9NEOB|nr:unnamed protein product [Ranitomeya imitator]